VKPPCLPVSKGDRDSHSGLMPRRVFRIGADHRYSRVACPAGCKDRLLAFDAERRDCSCPCGAAARPCLSEGGSPPLRSGEARAKRRLASATCFDLLSSRLDPEKRPRAASLEGGWRVRRARQLHQRRNQSINSVIYPRARRLSKDVSVSPVLIRHGFCQAGEILIGSEPSAIGFPAYPPFQKFVLHPTCYTSPR
jgi:hypothetical protein